MKNLFYIQTLGCRLNQAESQKLEGLLLGSGWKKAKEAEKADLLVLNTCVVTHKAEKETRQAIRQLRRKNPKAKLVVAGCWVDKIQKFGGRVPERIDELLENEKKWEKISNKNTPVGLAAGKRDKDSRVLIKIQTGCANACSYCLPCLIRGKPISVPVKEIVCQSERAINNGALEIVLTGQNVSQYSDNGKSWIDLVEEVLKKTDVKLLRLGSINPMIDVEKLISIYKKIGRDRLARHLHLSLQSGSNRILKLMNRCYTTEQFEKIVKIVRRRIGKGLNITTDIIVGFPGETEKDFQKTLDFVKKIKFGKIHIFRYSLRKGTPAAEMENQIDERTKKIRAKKLAKLEKELRLRFWQSQIGKKAMAIVWPDGKGLSDNYIPIASMPPAKPLATHGRCLGISQPRCNVGTGYPVLTKIKFVEIAGNLVYFN